MNEERWRRAMVMSNGSLAMAKGDGAFQVLRFCVSVPREALRLQQEQGYTILDVRPEAEFAEAHAAGAVNAQLYRLIKEWTPWDIARRAGFAFFGIFAGTEENPEFLNEVKALNLAKDAKIILGCQSGGIMKPSPSLSDGQQSRSLIAAYVLTMEGYKNLLHMEGGFRVWFKEDLPVEGTDLEEENESSSSS